MENLSQKIREDIRSVWARGFKPIALRAHSSVIANLVKEYNGSDIYCVHWLTLCLDPIEDNSLESWKVIHGKTKVTSTLSSGSNT